jgi:hypothetical protein
VEAQHSARGSAIRKDETRPNSPVIPEKETVLVNPVASAGVARYRISSAVESLKLES